MIRKKISENPYYYVAWQDGAIIPYHAPSSWECDTVAEKALLNNDDNCIAIYGKVNNGDDLTLWDVNGMQIFKWCNSQWVKA